MKTYNQLCNQLIESLGIDELRQKRMLYKFSPLVHTLLDDPFNFYIEDVSSDSILFKQKKRYSFTKQILGADIIFRPEEFIHIRLSFINPHLLDVDADYIGDYASLSNEERYTRNTIDYIIDDIPPFKKLNNSKKRILKWYFDPNEKLLPLEIDTVSRLFSTEKAKTRKIRRRGSYIEDQSTLGGYLQNPVLKLQDPKNFYLYDNNIVIPYDLFNIHNYNDYNGKYRYYYHFCNLYEKLFNSTDDKQKIAIELVTQLRGTPNDIERIKDNFYRLDLDKLTAYDFIDLL